MIRLSKLTDYGIVLMSHFAHAGQEAAFASSELAQISGIPQPTVSKVLKALARGGMLVSTRGVNGGYSMARKAEEISVAEMIDAMEGPFAMTQCTSHVSGGCGLEAVCPVRGPWQKINHAVRSALAGLNLKDMTRGGN